VEIKNKKSIDNSHIGFKPGATGQEMRKLDKNGSLLDQVIVGSGV
jgi:hypothetical protein